MFDCSGIRLHFPKLIKNLSEVAQGKAQLGLGHSYSRAKVKFNVNRADNMIIQAISLLDQLDKDVNTFSMRIRLVLNFSYSAMCLTIMLCLLWFVGYVS
jgi:RNA processing factor Prp31